MQAEATAGVRPPSSRLAWSLLLLAAASVCLLAFPGSRQAVVDACATAGSAGSPSPAGPLSSRWTTTAAAPGRPPVRLSLTPAGWAE